MRCSDFFYGGVRRLVMEEAVTVNGIPSYDAVTEAARKVLRLDGTDCPHCGSLCRQEDDECPVCGEDLAYLRTQP